MFPARYFPVRYFAARYFTSGGSTGLDSVVVSRELPADVLAVVGQQNTQPFHIVKIEFSSGIQYLSEAQSVTFENNTYREGAVKVGSFVWGPDGRQFGNIGLLNENDVAAALMLSNVIQDIPISIYLVYSTGTSTNTTPVFLISGVLSGSNIGASVSSVGVLTSKAGTEFAPRDFYTVEEGFNHLPPTGTVVQWAGEKFVLQGLR